MAGLPADNHRLTPSLLARAARRAHMSSRLVREPLARVKDVLLPAVLLLQGDRACVLLGWSEDRSEALVVLPELGDAPIQVSRAALEADYLGTTVYVRPSQRFDARAPQVKAGRHGHWFWSVLAENHGLYRDVLLAARDAAIGNARDALGQIASALDALHLVPIKRLAYLTGQVGDSDAELLGLGDEVGTIEPGKSADLIAVAGDPLPTAVAGFAAPSETLRALWPAGEEQALSRLARFAVLVGALPADSKVTNDAQETVTPGQLRAEFEQLLAGRAPSTVIHHCGSGVSAIPNLLGMEVAGLGRSALYAGSWSEWCNTPGLPCAQSQVAPPAADTTRG